jgi:hypothetical protein
MERDCLDQQMREKKTSPDSGVLNTNNIKEEREYGYNRGS